MCGKYYKDREFIPRLNTLFSEEDIYPDEGLVMEQDGEPDVSPTDRSVIIHMSGDNVIASDMEWGFRDPYHDSLVINARAESLFEKKMFSESVQKRRCLIPASGYYEWDSAKARYRFSAADGELIPLAGLYRQELGKEHYTIITTEANNCMAPVHPRMPLMIDKSEIRKWLTDNDFVREALTRRQEELKRAQDAGQISMGIF